MHDNKYICTYLHIGDIEFFKEQNHPPATLKRQDSVLPTSLNLNTSFDDDGNEVSHRSLTRQVSVLDPSLIMNTLFDDSGCIIEDIQSKISENNNDPDYIATTNAILNTHLTHHHHHLYFIVFLSEVKLLIRIASYFYLLSIVQLIFINLSNRRL